MVQRHLLSVQAVDVSRPGLMILNNGIGAALAFVVLSFVEPKQWHYLSHAIKKKPNCSVAVALSCIVGCAISYTGLWLQRLVTATSFMVLGSLVKVLVIVWGIFMFGEAQGFLSILGAALSVGGAYAYARTR